jgi:UDP-N-acetylmuramoyl-L-alanyl-D-glutamate--2,6-diaminopimelate ligase
MAKLSQLIEGVEGGALVGGDPEITGVVYDSRQATPGALFICLPGAKHDGHDHAQAALEKGAVALLVERQLEIPKISQVLCPDSLAAMLVVAENYYGKPADKLELYGVTGTNGKTTCCYLLRGILEAAGKQTGLLGTLEYSWRDVRHKANMTTPCSLDLQRMLAEMAGDGIKTAVMEVSSHALSLQRVRPEYYRAAAFTNLSQDHLDYHGDMENYLAAKLSLFQGLSDQAVAVYNRDDAGSSQVAEQANCRTVSFGMSDNADY